jgi:O-antigen ligase
MAAAWRLFLDYPIFGAGLGSFFAASKSTTSKVIHSTPLWLLAEFGLVGTAIFVLPVARIAAAELRRIRGIDASGRLALLIIIALAIMSFVHELLYQRTFWLLLGAALACTVRAQTPKPSKTYV